MKADLNCHLVRNGEAMNNKSLFLTKTKICLKLIIQYSGKQPKTNQNKPKKQKTKKRHFRETPGYQ